MPRRRPVKDAATEVETLAIEARELLAQLSSDGIEIKFDFLGMRDALTVRVKIPIVETANHEKGE